MYIRKGGRAYWKASGDRASPPPMLGPSGGRETSAALMMNDPGRQYEYYYTFVVIPKVDDLFGRKVFAGCELEAVNLLQDGERIRCLYLLELGIVFNNFN